MLLGELGEARTSGCERSSSVHTRRPPRATTRPSMVIDSMKDGALPRNAALQLAGVDVDGLRALGRPSRRCPRRRVPGASGTDRRSRAATVAKPVHLIEPSGQYASGQLCSGSGLPSSAVSAKVCVLAHRAARPRHAPTHSALDPGCRAIQPHDAHRPVAQRLLLLLHRRRRGGARQNSNCTTSCDLHGSPQTAHMYQASVPSRSLIGVATR